MDCVEVHTLHYYYSKTLNAIPKTQMDPTPLEHEPQTRTMSLNTLDPEPQ